MTFYLIVELTSFLWKKPNFLIFKPSGDASPFINFEKTELSMVILKAMLRVVSRLGKVWLQNFLLGKQVLRNFCVEQPLENQHHFFQFLEDSRFFLFYIRPRILHYSLPSPCSPLILREQYARDLEVNCRNKCTTASKTAFIKQLRKHWTKFYTIIQISNIIGE